MIAHGDDGGAAAGIALGPPLVMTDETDYLVWYDGRTDSLVAAFANARAYFAGGV